MKTAVVTLGLKPDPPVRRDGKCAVCRGPRPESNKGTQIPNHAEHLAADPFCTAVCARVFHDVPISTGERGKDGDDGDA